MLLGEPAVERRDMEIQIGDIKLTAEEGPNRAEPYIIIETLGDRGKTMPWPKVLASHLKAAIEALEKSCWRT